jgi:TolA-binding protein
MGRRGGVIGLIALFVLAGADLLGGCAYYNTFYTAKKNYKEAERQHEASGQEHPSPAVLDLYQRSIDKSQKLLIDYSKSKWVDDARYLIGMAYLRREEWEKARTGFEELIAKHPKSDLVPDAKLGIAVSLLGLGDHEEARKTLEQIMLEYPKFDRRDEVLWQLAESAAKRRDYRSAILGYSQLIKSGPEDDLLRGVLEARGDTYLEVDAPDSALADYSRLVGLLSQPEKRFTIELAMGDCLERLGRFDEALDLYSRLEREMVGPQQMPQTLLRQARTLNSMNRHPEALEIYGRVVTQFPASSYAAEAQYQIGITREDYLDDQAGAKEAYAKVKEINPSSEFASLADERVKSIDLYGQYASEMASGDESEKRAEANFKLAELTLFRMRKVDEALAAYQAVERDFPQSATAPRAAFAAAWIQEVELGDSLAAMDSYRRVHERYPGTEHGIVAGVKAGVVASDSLPIYLGQVLRIKAASDSVTATARAFAAAESAAAAESLLAASGVAPMPDSLFESMDPAMMPDSALAMSRMAQMEPPPGARPPGRRHDRSARPGPGANAFLTPGIAPEDSAARAAAESAGADAPPVPPLVPPPLEPDSLVRPVEPDSSLIPAVPDSSRPPAPPDSLAPPVPPDSVPDSLFTPPGGEP